MKELEEEVGGEKKGEKGRGRAEGEDFPGKFGKPPDRLIRQGPPSPKLRVPPPIRGRSPTPPSPLLTPICMGFFRAFW